MAQTLLMGFQRHYSIFREAGRSAKDAFEKQDWHGIRQLLRDRITFYDQRVIETCLLYTSPSPRDGLLSRMPSSA